MRAQLARVHDLPPSFERSSNVLARMRQRISGFPGAGDSLVSTVALESAERCAVAAVAFSARASAANARGAGAAGGGGAAGAAAAGGGRRPSAQRVARPLRRVRLRARPFALGCISIGTCCRCRD